MKTFHILVAALYLALSPPASAETVISEQWMEVNLRGEKIGFSYRKLTQTQTGYELVSKSVIRLQMAGVAQDISTSQTCFLDSDLKPTRFSYVQKMPGHRQFFKGEIRDGKIYVTVRSAGNVTKKTLPFDDRTQLADAVGFILGKKKLEEGKTYTFKAFMAPLMATETMEVIVGKKQDFQHNGKKEQAWQITSRLGSYEVTSYMTDDGRTLKETSSLGFETVAVDEAGALSFPDKIVPFTNLLTFSLIATDKRIKRQEFINNLKLEISGLSSDRAPPSDRRQKVTTMQNGTVALVTVQKENVKLLQKIRRPVTAEKFKKYLAPTFEAQSDDPSIVGKAKEIVGSETDAYESAVLINSWVYQNIEKKFIDTFSAVGTLKSLEGECQSHTNLFAALAKAVGIPVRTVSGIVYADEFGGFLYHVWPEVYAGGWIAMDPTFGQNVADATHIKLVEGDLSKQLRLFEFIGKIGIEIVSAERF